MRSLGVRSLAKKPNIYMLVFFARLLRKCTNMGRCQHCKIVFL